MAITTAGAILGASLIGAGSSYLGAKGANKRADQNAQIAAENIGYANQSIYEQTEAARPWRQHAADVAGGYLTQGYGDVYGQYQPMADQYAGGIGQMKAAMNPDVNPYLQGAWQDFDPGDFQASPDYQFRMNEGLDAVQGSAAAQGGLYSGNTLRGITDYASNLASGEYGNWWDRQMGEATFNRQNDVLDYGVASDNYGRDFSQQQDARDFNYARGQDFTNIGIGGIAGQAGATGGYYGAMADVYGNTNNQIAQDIVNAGYGYANNYMGGTGYQQQPYYSPWGGVNNAIQGGIENWFRYGGGGAGDYGGYDPYGQNPGADPNYRRGGM